MNDRKSVAIKGSIFSSLEQICTYILSFLTRRIIILSIGVDYLGLNSTLSQILGALSVTELGIQSVIIYRLYKPVVECDRNKICELLSVIRTFYRIVATVIFLVALILLPFLKYLVKDITVPWNQIYIAWILMAISTALSYIMNYNSVIIYADRKQHIYQGIHLALSLIIISFNLILLYLLHNYYIFLVINIINTIAGNLVLLILRHKLYPWIKFVKTKWSMISDVLRSALDLFFGRLCAYIFNSTDSIVISALISTSLVGFVGNYSTITMALVYLVSSFCGPIQAIVGNMLVAENKNFLPGFIKDFSYTLYVIGSILTIPTALLLEDFVAFFYGKQYILGKEVVYLLIIYVYLCIIQSPTASILDSDGQFKIQKYFYLVSSVINILLSVIGAMTLGVTGVLLGTIIGSFYLLICRIYYCYKVVVLDTKKELTSYIMYLLKLSVIFVLNIFVLKIGFNKFFPETSLVLFFVKGLISIFAILLMQTIFFRKTKEFRYMLELIGIKKIKFIFRNNKH